MTSMKTVLLGSAAAIVATGAAQAADLPVKKAAVAVQYVEVCPAFGSGFYKLPGTDICIKHFGNFKTNINVMAVDDTYRLTNQTITRSHADDQFGWQYDLRPGWDFRSPTAFGTLRLVAQIRFEQRNGLAEGRPPQGTGSARVSTHRAYAEWAGFTIGRAGSQFPYYDQGDIITSAGGDPKTTAFQVTYTFALGGGFKATIGFEDSTNWQSGGGTAGVGAVSTAGGSIIIAQGPTRMYDIVASLSTEQAWGSAKIAGLVHEISTIATTSSGGTLGTNCSLFNGSTANSGSCAVERETGWAVNAGVTLLLPSLGAGDNLVLQASYADGAIAAAGISGGADNDASSFTRSGMWSGGLARSGFDADAYAVNNGNGTYRLEKTKATSVLGVFQHFWNPLLRSNLFAAHSWIRPPAVATTATFANGGGGDANVLDVGANLIWGKSRQTAEIGVEVVYKKVNQDLPPGQTLPAGIDKDPSSWIFAAQFGRNW